MLQFDVIQYRLEHEYHALCRFDPLPYTHACWLTSEDRILLNEFIHRKKPQLAYDKDERLVFLTNTRWSLEREIKEHPDITFHMSAEIQS